MDLVYDMVMVWVGLGMIIIYPYTMGWSGYCMWGTRYHGGGMWDHPWVWDHVGLGWFMVAVWEVGRGAWVMGRGSLTALYLVNVM